MYPKFHKTARRSEIESDVYQRIYRTRKFIDESYQRPLDLHQISRQAFFSRYHFLRMFRKTFNKTPHQYLTQRRIERAKQLLEESSLSVTETCFEVGFESVGSFCSLFHKQVGHPPNLYRTQMAKRKQTVARLPELAVPSCFLKNVWGQNCGIVKNTNFLRNLAPMPSL